MSVKILNEIDVSEYEWCNSAIMFRVSNGIGIITHKFGKKDEDYCYYNVHLLINDKPILQTYLPFCSTCKGMLVTGYGIENIDCPELKAVCECLNSNYTNIKTSAEMLKPLLNLLEDGYYMLADVPHDPTDGNNRFFWSVPNKRTENPACCEEYYHNELYSFTDSFPQYLYPTQSADLCNEKRVNEYVEILKNNPNPPRALAYNEYGFISALLDGHHKATASALIGQKINCLTIIKTTGYSGVPISAGSIYVENFFPFLKKSFEDVKMTEYNLTGRKFPQAELNAKKYYMDIKSLMEFYSVDIGNIEFTEEIIDGWITEPSIENCTRLRCAIQYLMLNNRNMAYHTAVKIIKKDYLNLPYKEAWTALLDFKDEQTEQLFIDHIVEYGNQSIYYDIITSYWD